MVIKLETKHIRSVAIFEQLTGVNAIDCLIDEDTVYFVVEKEKIGMAIGRNGVVLKVIKNTLGKNVKIYGYSKDLKEFIKNMIPSVKNIEANGSSVTVYVPRVMIPSVIGKNGKNIKIIKEFLKRHFNINNLRIK